MLNAAMTMASQNVALVKKKVRELYLREKGGEPRLNGAQSCMLQDTSHMHAV